MLYRDADRRDPFELVMMLLNSDQRSFSLMRGMFFSPIVLSMSAAGVLWTFVLDYRAGS